MSDITEAGRRAIADIAQRHGLSEGAVETMARAIVNGGGTMAQFDIPELGGSGQWMAGGMIMVGDMFNHGLQARVADLCIELSNTLSQTVFFSAPQTLSGAAWWPSELGSPASVGGQNQLRYAYFPQARRLAVDVGGGAPIILLDTLDHQIGGFSQQQSGPPGGDPLVGVTFSSQYGQYALSSLPRVSLDGAPQAPGAPGPGVVSQQSQQAPSFQGQSQYQGPAPIQQPTFQEPQFQAPPPEAPQSPEPQPQEPPQQAAPAPEPAQSDAPGAMAPGSADPAAILGVIERLAALRDAGALTDEEFTAKKAELLARL